MFKGKECVCLQIPPTRTHRGAGPALLLTAVLAGAPPGSGGCHSETQSQGAMAVARSSCPQMVWTTG